MNEWYKVRHESQIDSPALLIYPDRVRQNIQTLITSVSSLSQLRPHVKTHKSSQVTAMLLEAGIKKVKCSTIAEAEMLARAGMPDILLAYQPVGPKVDRLLQLSQQFPQSTFACLTDSIVAAKHISNVFSEAEQQIKLFIDLNVGMNRTGCSSDTAFDLMKSIRELQGIEVVGLHAYDGHLRDTDFEIRRKKCDEGFEAVRTLALKIETHFSQKMILVAGGSPTFSIHRLRGDVECSPGTFIYWDKGYETILAEQSFLHAALVMTRVISLPATDLICVDLGHKAIASENPLHNRVFFLNAPELTPVSHSEEHMVFRINEKKYHVGDVLYGVPYHVCPTVALHDVAHVISDHQVMDQWITESRKRFLTI